MKSANIKWYTEKNRGNQANAMVTAPGTDVAIRHRTVNSANAIGWATEITFYRESWLRVTVSTWIYVGLLQDGLGKRMYFAPASDGKEGARKLYQTKTSGRKQVKMTCDEFPEGDYILEYDREGGLFFISSDFQPFKKESESNA